MKSFFRFGILFLTAVLTVIGCSGGTGPGGRQPGISMETGNDGTEKIFIEDVTGKKWNITHAVEQYGFEPSKFQFGLGTEAIPPILNPQFVGPGEPGYPMPSSTFLMIGFNMFDENRAYPLSVMFYFEIANDMFKETPVAVGY